MNSSNSWRTPISYLVASYVILRTCLKTSFDRTLTGSTLEQKALTLIPRQVNWRLCCQRLFTADTTLLRKDQSCLSVMMRIRVPPTRYTVRRNSASVKDLIV